MLKVVLCSGADVMIGVHEGFTHVGEVLHRFQHLSKVSRLTAGSIRRKHVLTLHIFGRKDRYVPRKRFGMKLHWHQEWKKRQLPG